MSQSLEYAPPNSLEYDESDGVAHHTRSQLVAPNPWGPMATLLMLYHLHLYARDHTVSLVSDHHQLDNFTDYPLARADESYTVDLDVGIKPYSVVQIH